MKTDILNNKANCGEFGATVAVAAIAAGEDIASVAKHNSVDEQSVKA